MARRELRARVVRVPAGLNVRGEKAVAPDGSVFYLTEARGVRPVGNGRDLEVWVRRGTHGVSGRRK